MKLVLRPAFTIVDLLLVIGLLAVVFSLTTVNLLGLQNKPSLSASVQKLLVDLKSQQNNAMVGDSGGGTSTYSWGVFIEPNRYTLFRGAAYLAGDSYNFTADFDSNITLSTDFPNNTVVFNKRSGEVVNYSAGADSITVTNASSGESRTLTLNSLGVATVN